MNELRAILALFPWNFYTKFEIFSHSLKYCTWMVHFMTYLVMLYLCYLFLFSNSDVLHFVQYLLHENSFIGRRIQNLVFFANCFNLVKVNFYNISLRMHEIHLLRFQNLVFMLIVFIYFVIQLCFNFFTIFPCKWMIEWMKFIY